MAAERKGGDVVPDVMFCRVEDTLISRRATSSLLRYAQSEGDSASEKRAQEWFDGAVDDGFWQRPVVADVLAAQLAGVPLVVVSDVQASYLGAVVEACGAEEVLCPSSATLPGYLSPRGSDVTAGDGRAQAVLDWCRRRDIDPARCRAYSDEPGDAIMLDAVGEGVAVVRTPQMRVLAEQHGWSTIDLSAPRADGASS